MKTGMPKSEIPNLSRNYILEYLARHPSRIGNIQLSLQKRFPDTYKKGGNLTQIHKHLKSLKELGLIDWKTINGETWYFALRKAGPYIVSLIRTELHKIERMASEVALINEEFLRDPTPEMTAEERKEMAKYPLSFISIARRLTGSPDEVDNVIKEIRELQ